MRFPDKEEPLQSATSEHPHYVSIIRGLEAGDDSVYNLFDITAGINSKFHQISSRYSVRNGKFYRDLDVLDNVLTDQVIRFLDEGVDDWKPLVAFLERVEANPSEASREGLYKWIASGTLTITDEGMIVGYKSVRVDGDGKFRASRKGFAVVDGVEVDDYVVNEIGSVIEMPRSMVDPNSNAYCSVGLHVGTWNYASNYLRGENVLEVHFDPADAVSVPHDDAGKVRVCRYKVIGTAEEALSDIVRGKSNHRWDLARLFGRLKSS